MLSEPVNSEKSDPPLTNDLVTHRGPRQTVMYYTHIRGLFIVIIHDRAYAL